MESIMEQIRIRLEKGETPQELINSGFKRTTVYSVKKRMEEKLKERNDEESTDRDVFLALIMKEAMGQILSENMKFDSAREPHIWKSITEIASDNFEHLVGRKPPEDFLASSFKEREEA